MAYVLPRLGSLSEHEVRHVLVAKPEQDRLRSPDVGAPAVRAILAARRPATARAPGVHLQRKDIVAAAAQQELHPVPSRPERALAAAGLVTNTVARSCAGAPPAIIGTLSAMVGTRRNSPDRVKAKSACGLT